MTASDLEHYSDPGDLDLIRRQLAPNASDQVLAYFAKVAAHLRLDPFAKEIQIINFSGTWQPYVTVAGWIAIAERSGEFRGLDGPYWTTPRDDTGHREWVDLWDDDNNPPYAARAFAFREGRHPMNGTVRWSEYANEKAPTWRDMPAHMLGEKAIKLALSRQFREVGLAMGWVERNATPQDAARPPMSAPVDIDESPPARIRRAELYARIADLIRDLGLNADGMETARRQVIADAVGRDVERAGELDDDELVVLIAHLETLVEP